METKKAAHSYTPWITMPISVCRIAADDGNGNLKMVAHAESPEDAAYIVRAVNNHEELVAALQIAVDALSKLRGHSEIAHDACERILRKNPVAFRRAANIDAKLALFDEAIGACKDALEWIDPCLGHAGTPANEIELARTRAATKLRALLAKIKG